MLSAMLLLSSALAGQDVSLNTQDGKTLQALANVSEDATQGVVMVHMYSRHAGDWQYLSERLGRSKVDVIAPNLRGHGVVLADDLGRTVECVSAPLSWCGSREFSGSVPRRSPPHRYQRCR